MTSTLLSYELTNLSSEAKRKNNELRTAAEKSLQELKGLPATSEHQIASDLSRRPTFIEPFLIACGTRNPKFAGSGVTCLQRLIISRGLPKARLQDALQAFNACTDLGLDIQLKILQALPSLLQNYADDLKGDLLSGALEVCSSLQSAKAQTVSGVAAATLQQLVASIFEKVANEDRQSAVVQAVNEVLGDDGPIRLRAAAFDAYRVFRDLILAAEDRKTDFVNFGSLSQESILELIWSCIASNTQLFGSHAELGSIVRSNLLSLTSRALSDKLSFQVTVRSLRILDVLLSQYITKYPADCIAALGSATTALEADGTPPWKRTMCMEILRNFFANGSHFIEAYSTHDMIDGGKPIISGILAAFVRLSAEKPAVIGLGQQSTVPTGLSSKEVGEYGTADAPSGVAGFISSALGVAEANVAGISSRWSIPKTACLAQLDKQEAPTVPDTYIYALVLECLGSLSESLAKIVLPLTVHRDRSKSKPQDGATNGQLARPLVRARSHSFRKHTVPSNPLEPGENDASSHVHAVIDLIETCWPAFLATSSTFLNSSLDDQYYRNLIKAYQRFTQVAGLLRLNTARDALMTTLSKTAIPSHILSAAQPEPPKTPTNEGPRGLLNSKGLLSVDNLVSQTSSLSIERDRKGSFEPPRPMLTTRHLLCLRALLNLAIALGPTLGSAFDVVLDTLRKADMVLSTTSPQQMARQGLTAVSKGSESPNVVQAFSNEVAAVEGAASRLLESTADYPDDAFVSVLYTFCRLLHDEEFKPLSPLSGQASPPPTPTSKSRTFSGLGGITTLADIQPRNYKFALPKLGSIAELNVSRFASGEPHETGWNVLIEELVKLASNNVKSKEARRAATDVLCKVAAEMIGEVVENDTETRAAIQRRTMAVLLRLVDGIYSDDGELTNADMEVQSHIVDALQAILEKSGESLVAGWNRTVAIISSVFERTGTPPDRQDDEQAHIDWEHVSKDLVSAQLGRSAFAATQLICSDFLSALPITAMPSLIELLYRFSSQTDDLNISLTTITMAWNVSDFVLGKTSNSDLDSTSDHLKEADSFEDEVLSVSRDSTAAQWVLSLLRLQNIIRTGHAEVRKAAFQTVCSIFRNRGDQMTPGMWDLALRKVILRIAFDDVLLYSDDVGSIVSDREQNVPQDPSISNAIIAGTSEVVAQNVRLIEQVAQLPSLWEAFLSRLEAYIDVEKSTLIAAVFQSLSKVLSRIEAGSKTWTGPMYRTLHLWLKRNPSTAELHDNESNQEKLIAYVEAGTELYRLTQQGMSVSQTRTFVENLYLCVQQSDGPKYGGDISTLSPLQAKALDLLRIVKSDTPSALIVVASKLMALHHDLGPDRSSKDGPTFVAISAEAVDWTQSLVMEHIRDPDLLDNGVFTNVLENLRRTIEHKYSFKLEPKETSLWRKATESVLVLARPLLAQIHQSQVEDSVKVAAWMEIVRIASGIVKAQGLELIEDESKVYDDQIADMESFQSLRQVIIPHLGDPGLQEDVRLVYTRSLFEASIIHATEADEIPAFEVAPLQDLQTIRRGRVKRVPYSRREMMSYECFSELIDLASGDDGSVERKNLAQAAAPLLILRIAIPIRAYIADQPLRGRRPQPLSELEELLFSFEAIKKLVCEPKVDDIDSPPSRLIGPRAYLCHLHPLLVKAVTTAGDRWSGAEEVLTPLQIVLSAISQT